MNLLPPSLLDAAVDHPVMVGFSGGLDSTVLLHLLAHAPNRVPGTLRAVHIHHGLQADADTWAEHCARFCQSLGVDLRVIRVDVPRDGGDGLEAAARKARHAAFKAQLQSGEWLALAHHLDDQAETFLLRALRGSGVDGLAAMRMQRPFGNSQLWRPLLQLSRDALQIYAQQHRLDWIEDPSNTSTDFDRNFLRLQVLPLLRERWPHAAAAMARSAGLAAQAADLLTNKDRDALRECSDVGGTLRIDALAFLPDSQQARVLRLWIRQHQLPPLPANGVHALQQMLLADHDQQPEFRWQQACIVRWRDHLHVRPVLQPWPAAWQMNWDGRTPAQLPDGSVLSLSGDAHFQQPLLLRQRHGGERIQLAGRNHHHSLKHCLQQRGIPPWLRGHLPLLCDGDEVLAAGDQILSGTLQQWLQAHAAALHWQPPRHAN